MRSRSLCNASVGLIPGLWKGARKMPKRSRWLIGDVPPLLCGAFAGLLIGSSWRFIRGSPTGDWIDTITAPFSELQGVVICQKAPGKEYVRSSPDSRL